MKIVVFGLSVSSSWGNGHATLWRGLSSALATMGHHVVFFERDTPYYAAHRDGTQFPGCEVRLYPAWNEVETAATREVESAEVAMVTSYCGDGAQASELVLERGRGVRAYYDLDTPVTLDNLEAGLFVPYLPRGGLGDFDLVLSFTGGRALSAMQARLGARNPVALYGSVDPDLHRPAPKQKGFECDLAHLGTFAADRRAILEELFVEPARRATSRSFVLAGALYPAGFSGLPNVRLVAHVPASEHGAFFSSAGLSLNVTRGAMARWGHCPSGRLFEAAACGAPQLTDAWDGLDEFFDPRSEIRVVQSAADVHEALEAPRDELERMARLARERVLAEHSALARARELVNLVTGARTSEAATPARKRDAEWMQTSGAEEKSR